MSSPVTNAFDPELPSPLRVIRRLRADAQDAVVAVGNQTESQGATYVSGQLDEAITELARLTPPPHAIFISGSAGGGKSGAAEFQRQQNEDLFSAIVEDATHADDPSQDQAEALASRIALLGDESQQRPERPILIAANIGMILQLARAWKLRESHFDALTAQLFSLLGLPGAPLAPEGIVPLDVRVLNLDDRPTAGGDGLLMGMLQKLLPGDPVPGNVFDQSRCNTCKAVAYCPARANAILISTVFKEGIAELADRAAIVRGRQDTPRMLWDYVSQVVLPDSHYGENGDDPCVASQEAYERRDALWVLAGLLPITVFGVVSDVARRIAAFDPARQPTREAYDAFADAGLHPVEDAERLSNLFDELKAAGHEASALELVAGTLLHDSTGLTDEFSWRDAGARFRLGIEALLGGSLKQQAEDDAPFVKTLDVYRAWQRAEAATASGAAIDKLLEDLLDRIHSVESALLKGLAYLFGQTFDDKLYLPVQNYDPRQASRAFVQYGRKTMSAQLGIDRAVKANSDGCERVGYRPLAVTLQLASGDVEIDLPTYRLLTSQRVNVIGGGEDAERTFALRRTAEGIARIAAEGDEVSMLVIDPSSGQKFRVTTEKTMIGGKKILHAQAASR